MLLQKRALKFTCTYFVTSGSHCTVRLGHSKAWVITKSYKNGVFFFQILYSSLIILSSTASSKGSWRKQHINQAINLARPQRNKHYTRTIFFRRSRHDKNWKLFPLVVNSSWQSERARWRAYSAPNSNITWPQRPNDISFLASAAVNESKLTEDSNGSWKAPNVGQ